MDEAARVPRTVGSPPYRVPQEMPAGTAPPARQTRPAPGSGPGVRTPTTTAGTARPAVAARSGTADTRRPYHVGFALGLSAGVYAVFLTSVSMLQFGHDRALIADRQPISDAITVLGRHNDEMAASLGEAGAVFEAASGHYADLAVAMQELHDDLVKLSRRLGRISELARIDRSGLAAVGGVSVGGVSVGGTVAAAPVARSAPKPGNVAPPPVTTTTGASGAP
jgi:hypothetical protein